MSLSIIPLVLGPLENNSYILADTEIKIAVIIDPSFEHETIINTAINHGLMIQQIWITHGHFDHLAGARPISSEFTPSIPIGLHPFDLDLWKNNGGAAAFGFDVVTGDNPEISFTHCQILKIGNHSVELRHTPGHTRGHVTFYIPDAGAAICGDVIFANSIGRTDLPGGDYATLIKSIQEQIFTLPPQTRLLCGHGPDTTVEAEMAHDPFFQ